MSADRKGEVKPPELPLLPVETALLMRFVVASLQSIDRSLATIATYCTAESQRLIGRAKKLEAREDRRRLARRYGGE